MATIEFGLSNDGFDMSSTDFFEGILSFDINAHSSTKLDLMGDYNRVIFNGTGLRYSFDGAELTDVTGGRVTSLYALGFDLGLGWTGLTISAPTLYQKIVASDWAGLNSLMFATSDSYAMTANNDSARGFGGNDSIAGFGGQDTLSGDSGRDRLNGGLGADSLSGGSGADVLVGGAGVDRISGGAGNDSFVFTQSGAAHADLISDFHTAEDRLQIDNAAFPELGVTGQLAKTAFVLGTTAQAAEDRLIYNKTTGQLWYDADGTGNSSKILLAELADGTTLRATDIFVI